MQILIITSEIFFFHSFDHFFIEKLSNLYRNLPLAIIIAITLVICLYLLINLAYLTALTNAQMIASDVVAIVNLNLMLFKDNI